eukprot:146290-Chlamydomonas_euryale.AAC.1
MLQENGVQGAVDHLHRTIYGALLAGRTFKWMKKGAARRTVITTTLEEGPNGPSGEVTFAGRFKSFFNPGCKWCGGGGSGTGLGGKRYEVQKTGDSGGAVGRRCSCQPPSGWG